MNVLKKIIVAICIILSIILLCFLSLKIYRSIDAPKADILGVQNDKVYFKMSPRQLIKIKGKPYDIIDDSDEIPTIAYFVEEDIYGIKCKSLYEFYKSFLGSKLKRFSTTIPVDNEVKGKELFYKINEHMTDIYSKKKLLFNYNFYNYFNNGFIDTLETDKILTTDFGTDNGAIGIRVKLVLDMNNDSLEIDINMID